MQWVLVHHYHCGQTPLARGIRITGCYTDTCHDPLSHQYNVTYTQNNITHAHIHTLTDSSTTMWIGTKAERVNVGFYLLQICGGI